MANKLTFQIGDVIKRHKKNHIVDDGLIILATKNQNLSEDFLSTGILKIIGIEKIAKNEIVVEKPFDYVIGKIKSFTDDYVNLDINFKFINVFEDELTR